MLWVRTQKGTFEEAIFTHKVNRRVMEEMTSGTGAAGADLAEGEAPGVDVHLGEAQVFERGG